MKPKPVEEFPNYQISPEGIVTNKSGRIIKPETTRNGYQRVSLSNDKIKHKRLSVHRLVAEAFIPNPDNLPQVNHIDENRLNNRVSNLEWCTPLQNLTHSKVIEKASIAKHHEVRCITTGKIYGSIKHAAAENDLCHSNIVACCNGRRKSTGRLEWEYVKEEEK